MFRISKVVKDFYDDIKSLSSYLGKSSDFSDPCAIEKIKKWEKDNNITIPKMYKSWLLLSEYAYVYGGYCELYFPELESLENDDVLIGNIIGDGDHLYFSKKTGKFFSVYGEEQERYDDFDEFLSNLLGYLEEAAEEEFGEDWLEVCSGNNAD